MDVPKAGFVGHSASRQFDRTRRGKGQAVLNCVTWYEQGDDRMTPSDDGLFSMLVRRGISRRAFLRFCTAITGALALPATYAPRVEAALATAPRVPLVWLRGQGCGGDGEALLRAARPTLRSGPPPRAVPAEGRCPPRRRAVDTHLLGTACQRPYPS